LPNYDIMNNVSLTSLQEVGKMKSVAIYARRSVSDEDKGNNSFSVIGQIEDCKNTLNEEELKHCKIYIDDGKSGKNMDERPEFMRMYRDALDGSISRIVFKKIDRFSRCTVDGLTIVEELKKRDIIVLSLSEHIDTTTPQGWFMLTIYLGFAENERLLIAERVRDAYNLRANMTGFYQGGKTYYGYYPERRTINGKMGSVLVPNDKSEYLKIAFEMYTHLDCSLTDILNYFRDNGININATENSNMDFSHLSRLLKSPLYVKADINVYQYLVSNGIDVIDDIEAFDGVHGLFRHSRKGLPDYVKVGYHEGIVDSETWLAVQDRKSQQIKFPNNNKAKSSWLVGLVKCGHCHYALDVMPHNKNGKTYRYYQDSGFRRANRCIKGRLKIRPDEVERQVYEAIKERLNALVVAKKEKSKPDKEVERIQVELIRIEEEINGLIDKLAKADDNLLNYIKKRVNELTASKSDLEEQLRTMQRKHKQIDTTPLTEPLSKWEELSVEDKHALAKLMIEIIYVKDGEGIEIVFSI